MPSRIGTNQQMRARCQLTKRFAFMVLAGALVAPWCASGQNPPKADLVATTEARTPDGEKKGFHLPPGFEAQLVAAEPGIHKPMNIAFDNRGRLWVTSTVEYPYPVKEGATARDAVKILDDFDDNGRARKITTFAEGLNIPIGILPLRHGTLVHSIPNISRLVDDDADGKADKREVYYASIGSADTHGMINAFTWGFDGWIYACHGFANNSTIAGRDGKALVLNSGNTVRFRPDGSRIEQFTWGQVNPFGLTFDRLGNLYSCDCHSRPISQLLRGAYYSSFGKPDDGLGYGPEMMSHDHFSTGIAGITYYDADHFPEAWRGTIFVGNVVTSRINHDRVEWRGSTPKAIEQPDFLVSDDPWFRPVDFELGPDGALYVADFYNRIIGHYEVPLTHPGRDRERGRIWRIVYRGPRGDGKPVAPRSDWTKATSEELVSDLGHPNIAVRMRAANELTERGDAESRQAALGAAQSQTSALQRAHAIWILFRLGKLDDVLLARAAKDPDRLVRVHLERVLAELDRLPESQRSLALAGLKDPDAAVRRAAAEALGRHSDTANIRPLLEARFAVHEDDTHLLHVVRMALRDQLRSNAPWTAIAHEAFSREDLRALADVAVGVPTLLAARFLVEHLRSDPENPDAGLRYVRHIARYGDTAADEGVLAFTRRYEPENSELQASFFKAMQSGASERGIPISESARARANDIARSLLDSRKSEQSSRGIELAEALKLRAMRGRLLLIMTATAQPEPLRIAAVNALANVDATGAIEPLSKLLQDPAEPIGLREQSANALARMNQEKSRAALLDVLPVAPSRLQAVIAAGLAGRREGALGLLGLVERGKASPRVLQDRVVQFWLKQADVPALDERLGRLTAGIEPADQRIQALIDTRRSRFATAQTDLKRGEAVFEKACAVCHQLGGKGAKVGPQLDGIGIRGADRLLEDLLDPNRNVDQAFRLTTLGLANGQVVAGLLLREEGEALVMADSQGKEVVVPKSSVEERKLSQLSPMPANLSEQIAELEFYDLLAYLLSQKVGKQ
jgi:putative heme-binding domain-containing protein